MGINEHDSIAAVLSLLLRFPKYLWFEYGTVQNEMCLMKKPTGALQAEF